MREEIGQWFLPGVAVGVEDMSDETANDINNSLENLSEHLEFPEIRQLEFSKIEVNSPEFKISELPAIQRRFYRSLRGLSIRHRRNQRTYTT